MESQGRKIHGQAAHAREASQHLEALKLYDEAILAYLEDNDLQGLAEVFADRAIVYRHLFDQTGNRNFLLIAKGEMTASLEIAQESGQRQALAMPYFQLGSVERELEQLPKAVESYKKALENITRNPPDQHNRAAIVADFKGHLASTEYRAGDKSALDRAEQALVELQAVPVVTEEQLAAQDGKLEFNQEVKYNKDVWLSGAHMRIAEMLKEDDPTKAKEHLQKAKEIIDANPELTIRKTQWEKLAQTF